MPKQIGFGDIFPAKGLKKYFNQILKTRRFSYGAITQKLEKKFGQINGCSHYVYCSSGTAALFSSIGVLVNLFPERAKKRKYIVTTAVNFISDYNVIHYNGFEPLFVDVASNYNVNYSELEKTLKNYRNDIFAVIIPSLMGRPVDGLKIRNLIETYTNNEAFFILDSCENLNSKFDGEYPEKYADFTAWSTYLSHLLVGGAVGGFIGTNNEKWAIWARSFVNHGRDAGYLSIDADNNLDEATLKDITAKRFSFVQHGLNFRADELNAAVALSMLEDNFEALLLKRKKNAEYLIGELSKIDGLKLPTFSEKEQARHMMLPVMYIGDTNSLINHLEKEGVETRPCLPLYQKITEKHFGSFIKFETEYPMAALIYKHGLYVGCHPHLEKEDLEQIVGAFKSYFKVK